jgi:hypothetical protein
MIVGVELWTTGGLGPAAVFPFMRRAAQVARAAGFDLVAAPPQRWVGVPSCLDPFQVVAALSAESDGTTLATGPLLAAAVNPVDLAERIATVHHAAGGRLLVEVRLSAEPWEVSALGIDPGEVEARTVEAIGLWRRLWFDDVVDHAGPFTRLTGARPTLRPHGGIAPAIAAVVDGATPRSPVLEAGVGVSLDGDAVPDTVVGGWVGAVRRVGGETAVYRFDLSDPARLRDRLDRAAGAGCTHVIVRPRGGGDRWEAFLAECGAILGVWRRGRAG